AYGCPDGQRAIESPPAVVILFFFNDAATTEIYTLSLHDALPILPLRVELNGEPFGCPDAGQDMTFDFPQLVAHAARTRRLAAGTIIGSGTVSNKQGGLHGSSIRNGGVGYCCIAEVRMYETIEGGAPVTPFMRFDDRVRIHMSDARGEDIFGIIEQTVERRAGA